MKVSIITATYNSEKTIVDTIQSLESQTYQNIEYIIIDGASKDDTVNVIETESTRVTKLISEPDNGIYDALNKGIDAATGDIIGFLHSDDLLAYPGAISDLVECLNNNSAQAVYADLQYVSQADTSKVVRLWESGHFAKRKMRNGWMPPHPTFFMSKELYRTLGGFNLDYKIAADYDSILRYLWKHDTQVAYLPKVVTKMRVGGASNRSLDNIKRKSIEDIQAMKSNDLPWLRALLFKNLSKIPQFFKK